MSAGPAVRFLFPPCASVHLERAAGERLAIVDALSQGAHPGLVAHLRGAHLEHLRNARRAWSPGRALAMIERAAVRA